MIYSLRAAKNERQLDIQLARMTRDSEGLYHLANYEKEEGNDELAEALRAEAKKIDDEDARGEELEDQRQERADEYREAQAYPAEGNVY